MPTRSMLSPSKDRHPRRFTASYHIPLPMQLHDILGSFSLFIVSVCLLPTLLQIDDDVGEANLITETYPRQWPPKYTTVPGSLPVIWLHEEGSSILRSQQNR
ncbi:hypothetical protein QYE76_035846 [Lolium multiflorum]|uniref:Uncharacterized protein n=1 Tax=Lolium multiflorum TaxID=4521 RepID=A0AAD8R008_LOLMU|nr:hypothetical protein QYE76_035846 [Lolium multiflorum]